MEEEKEQEQQQENQKEKIKISEVEEKSKVKKKRKKKIIFWSLIVIIFLGLVSLGLWQMGVLNGVMAGVYGGELKVTVADATAGDPVLAAKVTVGDWNGETNSSGEVDLGKIVAGKKEIVVSKAGYQSAKKEIILKRKSKINQEIALVSLVPRYKIPITIKDYFSEQELVDFSLSIDGGSVKSGDKMVLLTAGDHEVKVAAKNYTEKTQKVNISGKSDKIDLAIASTGRIVFVSNRDNGKRNIYTANYDGSDQKPLLEREGETENYNPALSPHHKKVVFLSTKDSRKDKNGNIAAVPYVIDVDGKNLKKISDDWNIYYLNWSPDGQYIYFNGYEKDDYTGSRWSVYDVVKNSTVAQIKTSEKTADNPTTYSSNHTFHFSSDDNFIAYANEISKSSYYLNNVWQKESHTYKIILANADNTNQKVIKETTSEKYQSVYVKQFGKDDATVEYYISNDSGRKDYSYNISTGETKEVEKTPDGQNRGQLLPDKSGRVYVDERDGKKDVFWSDPDGKNEKKLTDLGVAQYGWLEISPGSQIIFFNIVKESETARYGVSIKGGTAKKIVDIYSGGYRCGGEGGCGGGE